MSEMQNYDKPFWVKNKPELVIYYVCCKNQHHFNTNLIIYHRLSEITIMRIFFICQKNP